MSVTLVSNPSDREGLRGEVCVSVAAVSRSRGHTLPTISSEITSEMIGSAINQLYNNDRQLTKPINTHS